MNILSSKYRNDITPAQLTADTECRFIFAESGEAVLKTGATDLILSGKRGLLRFLKFYIAITTNHMNFFGCPDNAAAHGANIFSG